MTYSSSAPDYGIPTKPILTESPKHAICWASIFGGVFVALAVTIVLTILGSGLGFAIKPINPNGAGPSMKTLGVIGVIWMILVQWAASSVGGYITGRTRTRWANVHTHEVFFRDTAHGFVTWATATVIMMGLLAAIAAGAGHMGTQMAAHPMYAGGEESPRHPAPEAGGPLAYYVDALFRGDHRAAAGPSEADVRGEAGRILARGLKDGDVSEQDRSYLAQLVAARTGLSGVDARHRVDDVVARENVDAAQMREMAENARKSAATLSICIALSLMIGAFVASISAALGGNIRDRHN